MNTLHRLVYLLGGVVGDIRDPMRDVPGAGGRRVDLDEVRDRVVEVGLQALTRPANVTRVEAYRAAIHKKYGA